MGLNLGPPGLRCDSPRRLGLVPPADPEAHLMRKGMGVLLRSLQPGAHAESDAQSNSDVVRPIRRIRHHIVTDFPMLLSSLLGDASASSANFAAET